MKELKDRLVLPDSSLSYHNFNILDYIAQAFVNFENLIESSELNKKNYNMILSCYNYGRVTIIYDATVNY